MRSRSAILLLLVVGMLLAAGNVWFTALRSTIPRALDGRSSRLRFREHAAGVDDVCLLVFEGGRRVQVDCFVYDRVRTGEKLEKKAWSAQLRHGGQTIELPWSQDA